MKKYLLLVIIAVTFQSCEKNKTNGINPDAYITLSGQQLKSISNNNVIPGTHLTDSIMFISRYALGCATNVGTMFFAKGSHELLPYLLDRDTINNKLFLGGYFIVGSDNLLGKFVTDASHFLLICAADIKTKQAIFPPDYKIDMARNFEDTIGYIPRAVFEPAQKAVIAAFEKEDYEECYRIFEEAFVFVPTSGAKWRALKAAGIE